MIVLLVFAVLAGAGTALSPCVLPVLPALLSAGGVGGRRRPLGIVIGLSVTFTVTIVGVAKVVDGVGLGSDPLRDVAIVVLLVFGLALMLPGAAARASRRRSRAWRASVRARRGDGFRSGLLVGGALGFVYTPCAEPDPGGGDLGERRLRAKRSRSRSPTRSARRSCCSRSRSAAGAVRPRARGRAAARRCSARWARS